MLILCVRLFILTSLFLLSFFSIANDCSDIFGSKLYYEKQVISQRGRFRALHPTYIDPARDREQVELWDKEPPTPILLKSLLPEDIHFINHQLYQPSSAAVVKLTEQGSTVMARAHYKYQNRIYGTNVAFSRRALVDNLNSNSGKNWLVGENAKAAILFLHGGGTKSTGAHVAGPMISHFRNYEIDVLSLDLPWHGGGHREFLNFESEIKNLGVFAQKYIPPNVPLFVWGHSWGSVFSEQLMRMTDRPKQEFFFHNNLKGTIILSTAVDAAPGKSRKEKQEAFEEIKQYVRENPEQFQAAEAEQGFWKTIIDDGKISPLGAFYSSGTIFQLDQSPPSHQGRKFIPTLMVVGKHDPLVYHGFKDLYKVYETLKNVEAHYLDTLPYYKDPKGSPHREVGHLLGDYLDPVTREPIDFSLARKFIAEQLVLDSMKGQEIRVLNLLDIIKSDPSEIKNNDLREQFDIILNSNFLEQIGHPQIVDGLLSLRDNLLSNNLNNVSTIVQSLHQKLTQLIKAKQDAAVIEKRKEDRTVPAFIRLLQNFSNNLAFREFIRNYIAYNEKKTSVHQTIFKEKRPALFNKLTEILAPYSSPIKRINNFLNSISTTLSLSKYDDKILQSIKESSLSLIKFLDSNNNIISQNLLKDLKKLNDFMQMLVKLHNTKTSANDPNLNGTLVINRQEQAISELIQQIRKNHVKFFNSLSRNNRRPTAPIAKKLIHNQHKSISDVLPMIEAENLPPEIKKQVLQIMEEHFTIQSIVDENYIPTMNDIKQIGFHRTSPKVTNYRKVKSRVRNIIKKLNTLSDTKKKQLSLQKELQEKEKTLAKTHKELLKTVKQKIKIIKEEGLDRLSTQPPTSLRSEYQASREEFAELLRVDSNMERILDKIAVQSFENKESLNTQQIIELLNESRPEINRFTELFSQYVHNRSEIRKQAIGAIEAGEMGSKVQEAVIAIYGRGSMGERPVLGSKSIYLSLEKSIQQLAQVEAQLRTIKRTLTHLNMEYNTLMNSLVKLTNNTENEVRQLIESAANLKDIEEVILNDVLEGQLGTIFGNDTTMSAVQKEQVREYIDTYNALFNDSINTFIGLKSNLPPLLPTASD